MTTSTKLYCPYCQSPKVLWKAGFRVTWVGGKKQQYKCQNRVCGKITVNPSKNKPRRKE